MAQSENGIDAQFEVKAFDLAKKQREISVAEFFEKNRHLLGFDNKRKALLTAVKEAVDNSLDACEEARVLPEISVEIIDMQNDRFRIIVEDNGPGIVKEQIPKVFAKLLYGSKFYKLSQSRGQQGIGISAAVLYAQLTTGRPAKITSRISPDYPSHYYELRIDTMKNKPEIVAESEAEWQKEHGTKIELDLEGTYLKTDQSVDEYLKQTAIINPHVTVIYTNPKAEQVIYSRVTDILPPLPKEIKPHPYGVELGMLLKMLRFTECRTLQSFLTEDFSRVGGETAKEILSKAALLPKTKPDTVNRDQAEKLIEAIRNTKIRAPPTDCISPLGSELVEKGLRKEINAEFYCAASRPPAVYRGNPFIIEVGLAYGGDLPGDRQITVLRFANTVPLLYQPGACIFTKAVTKVNWKSYGLLQPSHSIPTGPMVLLIHMASVWVPFTSEAKEAVASYPEIGIEIKLALQELGRKLAMYVHKKKRFKDELKKRGFIEIYIPHISDALKDLLGLKDADVLTVRKNLKELLEKHRGVLEDMEFDPEANPDFDESLALKIPREKKKGVEDGRAKSDNKKIP